MRSKWVFVSVLALAVLSFEGSCRELQQESASFSSDSALGSTLQAAQFSPVHVAGSWSLALIDAASGRARSVNVEMNQIDDVIFGRGSIGEGDSSVFSEQTESRPTKDEGIESMIWWLRNDPDPVSKITTVQYLTIGASGLVIGNALSLDLIFLEENALYRLDLNVAGSSISGSYIAYDSAGRIRSGNCYGNVLTGLGKSALLLGSEPDVVYVGGMRSF